MNGNGFVHSSSLLLNTAAISCGIPHSVGNGSFQANQYTVGSQVTYHCDHGYHLDPGVPMTAVCLEDGSWSNAASPPGCLRKHFLFLWFIYFFQWFNDSQVYDQRVLPQRPLVVCLSCFSLSIRVLLIGHIVVYSLSCFTSVYEDYPWSWNPEKWTSSFSSQFIIFSTVYSLMFNLYWRVFTHYL